MSILELNLCLHKLKIKDKCQLKNGHTPISGTTAQFWIWSRNFEKIEITNGGLLTLKIFSFLNNYHSKNNWLLKNEAKFIFWEAANLKQLDSNCLVFIIFKLIDASTQKKLIASLQAPSFIHRLPRPMADFSAFKGSEFLFWLHSCCLNCLLPSLPSFPKHILIITFS